MQQELHEARWRIWRCQGWRSRENDGKSWEVIGKCTEHMGKIMISQGKNDDESCLIMTIHGDLWWLLQGNRLGRCGERPSDSWHQNDHRKKTWDLGNQFQLTARNPEDLSFPSRRNQLLFGNMLMNHGILGPNIFIWRSAMPRAPHGEWIDPIDAARFRLRGTLEKKRKTWQTSLQVEVLAATSSIY